MNTIEERKKIFLNRCVEKYGDRFDYSKIDFVNAKKPIKIYDTLEEEWFERVPELHLRYDDRNYIKNLKVIPKSYWAEHKEECYEKSLSYATRTEFKQGCNLAYNAALECGWLTEFFDNRDNSALYNHYEAKVHCVYAYEIPEYNTCYIGRTKRLNIRDRQHRNGVLRHGEKEYDNLYKFCVEKKIDIPMPIILKEGLNGIESQIEEDKYLQKYIDAGWNTINKARTGEGVGSLGGVIKWNYEKCVRLAKECKNKEQYKHKFPGAYRSSYVNGWLDSFFVVTKKPNGYWDSFENCQEEALKWRNVKEFSNKGGGAYNSSRKNGWLHDLKFKENA